MNSKTLIVYESKILFDILEEIKEHLNLEILNLSGNDLDDLNVKKYENFVVISLKKPKKNKGSAIFLHLTNNYKKTLGCIALKKKDMLILLKLINSKTEINIT